MIPLGFRLGGARCGLKNKKNDIGLLVSDVPARAAGVFTTNLVRASCVDFSRRAVQTGSLRGVVVNSGNANCCTGAAGERDTAEMAALAESLGGGPFAVASTGVIGHPMPMEKVRKGIPEAFGRLGTDPKPFLEAILTTDLVEKWAATAVGGADLAAARQPEVTLGPGPRLFGMAKGSGMIAPNMATMLGFVISDADVSGFDLPALVRRVADRTFNRCLVDGDTSTNDMLLVLANGLAGPVSEAAFEGALAEVCDALARQIARDGEGATKLVEVCVRGSADPLTVARTIALSPLVKTAMFGCDPNWGRIVAAAGRAEVHFCVADVTLDVAGFRLFEHGAPTDFDPKKVSAALKSDTVRIDLFLGPGPEATVYTCDFGYGYVRINAEYHT
jgi:glutamate N-acetyltransferase/amino-acid N-acetyltransferase